MHTHTHTHTHCHTHKPPQNSRKKHRDQSYTNRTAWLERAAGKRPETSRQTRKETKRSRSTTMLRQPTSPPPTCNNSTIHPLRASQAARTGLLQQRQLAHHLRLHCCIPMSPTGSPAYHRVIRLGAGIPCPCFSFLAPVL